MQCYNRKFTSFHISYNTFYLPFPPCFKFYVLYIKPGYPCICYNVTIVKMASEYPKLSQSDINTMLLYQMSLAYSSKNVENRSSDSIVSDGFVFDIDPSLLMDSDKLVIDEIIGEGSDSIVYRGW